MKRVKSDVKYEIFKTKIYEPVYTNVPSVDPELKQGLITHYSDQEKDLSGLFAVSVIYSETLNNSTRPQNL